MLAYDCAPPGYVISTEVYRSERTLTLRAQRTETGEAVIIKTTTEVIPPPTLTLRFHHEWSLLTALADRADARQRIVRAYDLARAGHRPALILEDFGGQALRYAAASYADLPLAERLDIAIAILDGLEAVHAAGLLHKDVNPSNVVLNRATGQVKLIDFSIAARGRRIAAQRGADETFEGTLAYIAPEQTGRLSGAIDARADLYSFGVLLYELLTGELPFQASDALGMIHAHLALPPPAAHQRDRRVPRALSDITAKLLAKSPDDRYQTAAGARADLAECLRQLSGGGAPTGIAPFPLGRRDAALFVVPQRLYGREREVALLREAFERACQSGREMVLVAGASGIGKTALIAELHAPVTARRGFLVSGKHDQLRGNTPYSAISAAFRQLVRQILAQSDAELDAWRAALSEALSASAALLLPLIPELALLVGDVALASEIPALEARHRFERAVEAFLGVFTARQRPLALFLDDAQWADAASLDLLSALARSRQSFQMLVILAYRDQETAAGHPLSLALDATRSAGMAMTYVTLSPLDLEGVTQLTAAAMDNAPEAPAVASIVYRKTGGNPFFARELLERLAADGRLTFQPGRGWSADLEGIAAADLTDNVVTFLLEKLHRCSLDAQRLLHVAACFGHAFAAAQVAAAAETDLPSAQAALEAAAEANLILSEAAPGRFHFVHDRVQQAAYELAPEDARQALHWRIGRSLLSESKSRAPEPSTTSFASRLFDIANHLNRGRRQASEAERKELAHLNLYAGRAAKTAAAFGPALEYLRIGIELLPADAWSASYDLTLRLHLEAAEAAFFSANPSIAQEIAQAVFSRARALPDALPAHEMAILAYSAQYRFHDALAHARAVLQRLGIDLPEHPSPTDIGAAWNRIKSRLTALDADAILALPEMSDPQALAASRLLYRMSVPAFLSNSALFTLIVFWRIELTLKHGVSGLAAASFAALGVVVSGGFQDPGQGYAFGNLARRLLDRLPSSEGRARTLISYYFFLHIWREPARTAIEPLRAAYREGLEAGDLEFASTALLAITWIGIFIGQPLDALERDAKAHSDAIRALCQERNYRTVELCLAYVRNLRVETDNPLWIAWGDSEADDAALAATGDQGTLGTLAYLRMKLAYLFGDYQRAYEQSILCESNMSGLQSSCLQPNAYLFGALARLARLRAGDLDAQAAEAMWAWIDGIRPQMARWAELSSANYAQKLHLLDAEIQSLRGDVGAALEAYDRAIALARENGFIHEEALANERAARYFLDQGRSKIARAYAADARRAYERWGATEKARRLAEQFGAPPSESDSLRSTGAHSTLKIIGATEKATTGSGGFDFASVMKAARALAGEIVQERLLDTLLRIALENAGATRGALALPREDGAWYVEAERDLRDPGAATQPPRPLDQVASLPLSVIKFALRTGESVLLADATESPDFGRDAYVQAAGLRSVICLPARHRGQVRAIVYLENQAVANVFTPQRREALTILAAQAAVSLENTRLYASLEEKVRQRTEELAEKNRQLEQTAIEILDGLRYAERIQRAILPTAEELAKAFAEHFILWRPRGIVSGDFYWLRYWPGKGRETRWLAVADCTGHGVPGALMAMIGNELLNQIVIERGIESPAAILDALDAGIRAALRYDARHDGQRDGMDIALCRLDADGAVTFAGAGRPLYVIEGGALTEVRGDRGGIGSRAKQRGFTERQLHLPPDALLYLSSDGFADQNDPLGRRYGSSALKRTLQALSQQPLPVQRQRLEQSLDRHQGGEPQRDDVTLVGIRLQSSAPPEKM